jgi:hypothetical protein
VSGRGLYFVPPRADLPFHTKLQRRIRREENHRKSGYMTIPVARRAWHVTLTAIEIPEHLLKAIALDSLPSDTKSFWVRRSQFAMKIAKADRDAGGKGILDCVEFRRCRVCKRVLIGPAAHEYQMKQRRGPWKWEFKQGSACGVECSPKPGNHRRAIN